MTDKIKNRVVDKLITTAISLKFWSLVIITAVSSFMLYYDKLSGSEWVTLILSMYSIILGAREFFKYKHNQDFGSETHDDKK